MADSLKSQGEVQLAQAAGQPAAAGDGAGAGQAAASQAPRAVDDCVVTSAGAEVTVPVLANDVGPEGASLSLLSASQPESGFVAVNADGTLTFAADEPGLEMIRYQIGDGSGGDAAADLVALVTPTEGGEGTRSVLAGLDDATLAGIARACAAPAALDQVVVDGATAVVERIEPGQYVRVESEPGQRIELLDPAFDDASYFVVDGGLLVITNDGRVVFLADFVSASKAADPVTLQVAGAPPVEGDMLLASLQPMVVPALGEDGGGVPPPDAGPSLAHGGGASFTPYDPGALPPGYDPLGPLPPTSLGFGEPPIIDADVDDFLSTLGGPDDGGPDNGGPDNGGPDNGGPDNGGPDNGGPDNGGPDNGGPDNGGPDNGGPDNGGPDDGAPADVAIVFQDEVAKFVNTLGVYRIGPDGEILEPRIVFPEIEHAEALGGVGLTRPGGGPLEPGDSVSLSSLYPDQLEPGDRFGLFLVSNGFDENDGDFTGELAFIDQNGNPATIFTPEPQLVRVTPGGFEPIDGRTFHTVDPTPDSPLENPLNPGGGGQSLAAFLSGDVITVVFEDQALGSDDDDFNDVVVTIEPVDPDGTSLVFDDLTPGFDGAVAEIANDPPGVEGESQVEPVMAAALEPILPTVLVEPDPGMAA